MRNKGHYVRFCICEDAINVRYRVRMTELISFEISIKKNLFVRKIYDQFKYRCPIETSGRRKSLAITKGAMNLCKYKQA